MSTPTDQALLALYHSTARLRLDLKTLGVKGPARALIDSAMERNKPAMLEAEATLRAANILRPTVSE